MGPVTNFMSCKSVICCIPSLQKLVACLEQKLFQLTNNLSNDCNRTSRYQAFSYLAKGYKPQTEPLTGITEPILCHSIDLTEEECKLLEKIRRRKIQLISEIHVSIFPGNTIGADMWLLSTVYN